MLSKWLETNPPKKDKLPLFRRHNGLPVTGVELNKVLKQCLQKHISYGKGYISSHSFRAGLASMMGLMGYADSQIMAVGRWSSNAFEAYTKLPRTIRLEMAKKIGNWEL